MKMNTNLDRTNYHWWGNTLHWYDHWKYGFIEQCFYMITVKPSGTVSSLDGHVSGVHPRWGNQGLAWYKKRLDDLSLFKLSRNLGDSDGCS